MRLFRGRNLNLTADDLLAEARRGPDRLAPPEAASAMSTGALLVDVRSELQRERDGVVPGSVFFPRERATDLAGGFQAWRAAGLTVEPLTAR